MSNVYKFTAEMTCSSCSNCISKVLEKNKAKGMGISAYNVDLASKEVTVTGTISQADLTDILNKTGIKTTLLEIVPQEGQ